MHAGLCQLRLPPQVFWGLTPFEIFAMTGGLRPRGAAADRTGLDALMARFPDEGRQQER